jgi:hypothetical protein
MHLGKYHEFKRHGAKHFFSSRNINIKIVF